MKQFLLALALFALPTLAAPPPTPAALERNFTQSVRPFLAANCLSCHSGKTPAAQLDLKAYTNLSSVVADHPRWALVADRLKAGDMPPKPLPRPDAAANKSVIDWIEAMRHNEARKNAGDPGIVLARRLSNAEYNYTIHDLTGVDIQPTREFPIDPANPEGFDNTGESLSMSPSLLNKYLQAARQVADHMVLKPTGIDFAPHPMLVETDREKYAIQRIIAFYKRQPTDYADYFFAAWQYKHRIAQGQPTATLASIAAKSKLSPKYLPLIWQALEVTPHQIGPLAIIQKQWKDLTDPKDAERARSTAVVMRDYVLRVRALSARHYESPSMKGLSPTSQPLMNWKLNEFAKRRREFDPAALFVEGEPLPEAPTNQRRGDFFSERSNGDFVARQAFAKLLKARLADQVPLRVPAGQRPQYEAAFAQFANLFPDAFYVSERGRFFPDDTQDKGRLLSAGFHNVMGYFRDDLALRELLLDDKQTKELESLWQEFDFIGDHTIRTYTQYYFNQSGEILGNGRESGHPRPTDYPVTASQIIFRLRDEYIAKAKTDPDIKPVALEAIEAHFQRVNTAIRDVEKLRADSEPLHRAALLDFAARAYRRPLTAAEKEDLLAYYRKMRADSGLTHEEAIRDSIVGVLMSPDFQYRIDLQNTQPTQSSRVPITNSVPLTNLALASRLSYFLWSAPPDEALRAAAANGTLRQPAVLLAHTRRMLKDERARRFATEFAGHWLDFRRFDQHNAVDRQRFPSFTNDLRQAMFEEPARFLEDLIRNNRSIREVLYAKHTFVNPVLAQHYGMPELKTKPDEWTRIDNAAEYGRGGLLPMSVFLTQNAPGLRTSPVKRGYWVVRRVLGENIPPPPANVPELPSDEAKADLPLREMLAKHRDNPSCAGCHARFDSVGIALEGYGPIGEKRTHDLAKRPIDAEASFPDSSKRSGLDGIQAYIREKREADFDTNFCRKLLAYALGRSLQLSDDITIDAMRAKLALTGQRFVPLIEAIVTSPQFLNQRGAKTDARTSE
jgi:mono/diheme cytochrome c family protein